MGNIQVKPVDVLGDTIIAAKDDKGQVWAGVSYFCKALGMSNAQRDTQVEKVQADKTLKKGSRKFPGGVFDSNNETVAIKIDFIPLWLAKIQITNKMEQEHPDLADKLLEYQLKAKDILSEAFIERKHQSIPMTIPEQIQLLAQGNVEVNKRIDSIEERFDRFEKSLPLLPNEADEVSNAVKKRVVEILGGKEAAAYKDKSLCHKVFSDAYQELKRNFNVNRYKDIKREQLELVIEIADQYQPPLFLKEQIKFVNAQQAFDI